MLSPMRRTQLSSSSETLPCAAAAPAWSAAIRIRAAVLARMMGRVTCPVTCLSTNGSSRLHFTRFTEWYVVLSVRSRVPMAQGAWLQWAEIMAGCIWLVYYVNALKNTDPPFRLVTAADRCHASVEPAPDGF